MKLTIDTETYISLYRARVEYFDEDYDSLMAKYNNSFVLGNADFQTLYDCLSIQLLFWCNEFEEDRDSVMMEKLLFEIQGLDFYKFYFIGFDYDSLEIIEDYDGVCLTDEEILEVNFILGNDGYIFRLEDDMKLEISNQELEKIFKCDLLDSNQNIIQFFRRKQLYFDGWEYYFVNEKNYKRLMNYMNGQLQELNKIYSDLGLREVKIRH